MRCPFCSNEDTRVVDSRLSDTREQVRRRRECEACGERFSTREQASLKLPFIIKSNGVREPYDSDKLSRGLERALEKRPVDRDRLEQAIHNIRHQLLTRGSNEIESRQIGEWVMDELRELDHVAYVRFASVYRSFEDIDAFDKEISRLRHQSTKGN